LWRAYPDEGCYETGWLMGHWSTQAKVESIVLKAAWHRGSDCSVLNDPLGEPGRTPLCVGVPSMWAPWTGTKCFPFFFVAELLIGDPDRYK